MDKQAIWFFLKSLDILIEKEMYDEARELIKETIEEIEKDRS